MFILDRSNLKTSLKILVSLAIVYLLVTNIDWKKFIMVIQQINVYYLLIAALFFVCSKWISAERFRSLLNTHVTKYSYWDNLKLYWKGMYYNLLLPGGISGDAYKIKVLNKELNLSIPALIKLVMTDRLSGMFALFQLGALLLLLIPTFHNYFHWIIIILISSFLIPVWLLQYVQKSYAELNIKLAIFSLMVQTCQLVSALFIIFAVAQESQLLAYLILFLASSLAAMIPITIGGAGARELCFYYGAPLVQASAEEAVAIAFIFYLISTFISLGGISMIFDSKRKS